MPITSRPECVLVTNVLDAAAINAAAIVRKVALASGRNREVD
jgi:hypothetical protein